MNIFSAKDFILQPWKNGGGSTLELYRISSSTEPGDFDFRISSARVDRSGPFSQFPGIDRHLLLLGDGKLVLKREGTPPLTLDEPFSSIKFPGEDRIECEVVRPALDFNVMVRRKFGHVELSIVRAPQVISSGKGATTFVYAVSSNLLYQLADEKFDFSTAGSLIVVRLFLK